MVVMVVPLFRRPSSVRSHLSFWIFVLYDAADLSVYFTVL